MTTPGPSSTTSDTRRWPGRAIIIGFATVIFSAFFAASSVEHFRKLPLDHWQQDLRADAAGYYIYLPGTFHHGMRAATVGDSLIALAGGGFKADRTRDRIITKYTCGTALLQLPFFLIAEAIEGWGRTDGWTRTHHALIEIAGVCYWAIGLLLIGVSLQRLWPAPLGVALITLAAIAFGTNSFYYAFRAPAFSHAYSFFLVALSLRAIAALDKGPLNRRWLVVFAAANSLIVLVRPIDALALLALNGLLLLRQPALYRTLWPWAMQTASMFLAAVPQVLYWKFTHGTWVVDSYDGEEFSNWASPKLAEVLIAPQNGALPNAPVFFLLPLALLCVGWTQRALAIMLTVLFAAVIYSCAAWHAWHFGCAYGMRPLVQYTPFLAIALLITFTWCRERLPAIWHGMVPLLAILCFINYRVMLQYQGCYPDSIWDWEPYGRNIIEAFFGKVPC